VSESLFGAPAGAAEPEREIRALLDDAEAALRAGDWPRYAAAWAHEPWIELLHPAEGEWLTGWDVIGAGYRALLASGARPEAERHRLQVRVAPSGEMAWAVAETVVSLPGATGATMLWITYVLERGEAGWRLVHGHASVPAGPPGKRHSPDAA
jgi:ketosteroid isomerase-like protein